MRKYLWSMMVCLLLSMVMVPFAHGEKNMDRQQQQPGQNQNQPGVQLTEAQKTELAKLHKDILEKKKEMVLKYVEFGVIPEEKGQMMITHFEKHYEMLEQSGFMLKMPQNHPKVGVPTPPPTPTPGQTPTPTPKRP